MRRWWRSAPPTPRDRLAGRWYKRPITWLVGLVVVLVGTGAFVGLRSGSSSAPPAAASEPTAVATAAPAPLSAHGIVQPVVRARVGTQSGGVIRTLTATAGERVLAQQELGVIQGPTGAEIVTSPFGGTVTDVLVHLGDTVVPGAVIASVADLSAYQIETTDVDQFLVAQLRPGQTVTASIEAINKRNLAGTVHTVAVEPATTSSGTKTYAVIISLPSSPADLRPGMTARLTFVP